MRVVLVQPPDEMEAMLGAGKTLVQKYEPLGLLYLAAVAREKGCDVTLLDAHAEGLDEETLRSRIRSLEPDLVGVSVLTCGGGAAHSLGRWMKGALANTTVVFGNVHASVFAEQYLAEGCCDFVVHGEGEGPFAAILDHLAGSLPLSGIPAVSYQDGGAPARNGPDFYLVPDLDALPPPARELADRSLYKVDALSNQLYTGPGLSETRTMGTSRGCRFRCTFCVVNQEQRFASPGRVVEEMAALEADGAGYIMFVDSLSMADPDRMTAICGLIRERGLRVPWGCDARVNCVTPALVREMQSANCHDLSFGIESGVQRLLNNVKKGIRLEQVAEALRIVRENSSLKVAGLFILGLPGETFEDSLKTIRFAKRLPLDMAQFSICTPYPGSELFEALRKHGEIETGVLPSGRLDPSVWKRYSAYISFSGGKPIWVTGALTPGRLKSLQKRAQREFYLRPSHILRHLGRLSLRNLPRAAAVAWKGFF